MTASWSQRLGADRLPDDCQSRRYAYREKRSTSCPLLKVKLLDKVGRKGKVKIRSEEGPHPGLEEYVASRQLVVPWGERGRCCATRNARSGWNTTSPWSGQGARRGGERGVRVDW